MTIYDHTQFPLSAEAFEREEHHAVFTTLRAEDPVHWYVDSEGVSFWCLTKHADIQMVNRDSETFTVTKGFILQDIDPDDIMTAQMMEMLPGLEGERHTRFRAIVNRGFTPRMLSLLEDHLAYKAKLIVDNVIERGSCDFVEDIAAELPMQAICELVGVPDEDRRKMFEWGNLMTGIDDPNVGGAEDGYIAGAEMVGYADQLRVARSTDPREDLVTKLTQYSSEDRLDGLTDSEFGLFFLLLIVAGNETTRNATTHGMRALIQNPDQLRSLRADLSPERLKDAVEEILRWASPIMYFRRTATKDVELRGKTIKAGDRVVMWHISGNRDEDVFDAPFEFDVDRQRNDHVTFGGGGVHFCLGANLARMELRLIFRELISRMPDLEFDGPVEMLRSNFVGGIKRMPVKWTTS